MSDPWSCPNDPPCPHIGAVHDVYDLEDTVPTCCIEGCRCGHPGTATLQRNDDDSITVQHADPVIRVSRELARELDLQPDQIWHLDTAQEYAYQFVRDEGGPAGIIYCRVVL